MLPHTIEWELRWIVLMTTIPMFVASALLLYQVHLEGRAMIERDAGATARALIMAVDRDLAGAQAAATVLATSPALQADDIRTFRAQATAILPSIPGSNIVLTDSSGQQVLNSLRPEAEALPRHGNPDLVQRVVSTGKPIISDLYIGGVRRAPVISIDAPVFRDGKVTYDLSVGFFPDRLAEILQSERLPSGWVAAIFDRRGIIVARTHAADQFVGKSGAPALITQIAQVPEGIVATTTLEGIKVSSVFSRSPYSGWAVAIGLPTNEVNARQWRSLGWAAAMTLALVICGLVAAHITGARLTRAIHALGSMALAFGRGQSVALRPFGLKEVDAVAKSLAEGASLLQKRTDERDRELEQRLKAQFERQAAEDAARDRSTHFAYLSHELRSPLLAIHGYAEMIARGASKAGHEQRLIDYSDRIQRGVDHVREIIDEILDYARYEANALEIHPEPVDAAEAIREAVELMEGSARVARVALTYRVPADLPELDADASRLRQILLNLLSNAMKFTRAGGTVTVNATMLDATRLAINVEDNGIGISADDLERVMQPFKQSQTTSEQRFKGTGLGLPLTKGLVELHGGSLTLKSTRGVGTVATVVLPIVHNR